MHLPRPPRRRSAVWASAVPPSATLPAGLPAAAARTDLASSASASVAVAVSTKIDSALRGADGHGREASFRVVRKNRAGAGHQDCRTFDQTVPADGTAIRIAQGVK